MATRLLGTVIGESASGFSLGAFLMCGDILLPAQFCEKFEYIF